MGHAGVTRGSLPGLTAWPSRRMAAASWALTPCQWWCTWTCGACPIARCGGCGAAERPAPTREQWSIVRAASAHERRQRHTLRPLGR
jgi:hypothetical protein